MRKLLALLLAATLLLPMTAWAEGDQKVVDLAGLLSPEEEAQLAQQAADFMADYGLDMVFCTTDDAGGKTTQAFADDYYDYNDYGAEDGQHSGVLLLIDMDNREVAVSTLGVAVDRINDAEVEEILDAMYQPVTEERYGDSLAAGGRAVAKAVKSSPIAGQAAPDSVTVGGDLSTEVFVVGGLPWQLLVGALAGGLVIGGLSVWGVKHSYDAKKAPDNYPLGQNAQLRLTQQQDILTGRNVTKSKIERNSSSGGGGGSTHRSSSGRSHGGGSRKF